MARGYLAVCGRLFESSVNLREWGRSSPSSPPAARLPRESVPLVLCSLALGALHKISGLYTRSGSSVLNKPSLLVVDSDFCAKPALVSPFLARGLYAGLRLAGGAV